MTRLPAIRERVGAALRQNADLLYPRTLEWRLSESDMRSRSCRCKVRDPSPVDASALSAQAGVPWRDIRLLKVHPDDPRPAEGMSTAWDGGRLEVLSWGQDSDFSGQAVATCVIRR